jgi:hypothetical protein
MQLYVWWPSTKILCAEWKTPPRICSTKEKWWGSWMVGCSTKHIKSQMQISHP